MLTLQNATLWVGEIGDDFINQQPVSLNWLKEKQKTKCTVFVQGVPVRVGDAEIYKGHAEWHPAFKILLPEGALGNYAKRIILADTPKVRVKIRYFYNPCKRKMWDLVAEKTHAPSKVQNWLDEGDQVIAVCRKNAFGKTENRILAISTERVVFASGTTATYAM